MDMHIVENKSKSGKKIYRSILLRESYREEGKVRKRTVANLSNCTSQEIEAIKLALSHKDDLSALGTLSESVELQEGLSVGAVWSVYRVAKELGIEEALGKDFEGKRLDGTKIYKANHSSAGLVNYLQRLLRQLV